MADHLTHAGEQQLQVLVDLCGTTDGRPTGAAHILARDGNRWRDPLDTIRRGLVELLQKLPRVSGEAFDVAALPLGIERIEREARLAAAAHAAKGDQLPMGQIEIDLLQVIDGNAAERNRGVRHRGFNQRGLVDARKPLIIAIRQVNCTTQKVHAFRPIEL